MDFWSTTQAKHWLWENQSQINELRKITNSNATANPDIMIDNGKKKYIIS